MAITFDAAANSGINNSTNTVTYSHTVAAGSDLILCVAVEWWHQSTTTPLTVSSVTYNGTGMTAVPSSSQTRNDQFGGHVGVQLFTLVAPSTGAHNVVITLSGSTTRLLGGSTSWSGVDQSTLGTAATAADITTTPAVTVTSDTGEFVFGGVSGFAGSAAAFTPGNTERWEAYDSGAGYITAGATETGAATVNLNWSGGLNNFGWVISGVSLKVSAGGGGGGTTGKRLLVPADMRARMTRMTGNLQ